MSREYTGHRNTASFIKCSWMVAQPHVLIWSFRISKSSHKATSGQIAAFSDISECTHTTSILERWTNRRSSESAAQSLPKHWDPRRTASCPPLVTPACPLSSANLVAGKSCRQKAAPSLRSPPGSARHLERDRGSDGGLWVYSGMERVGGGRPGPNYDTTSWVVPHNLLWLRGSKKKSGEIEGKGDSGMKVWSLHAGWREYWGIGVAHEGDGASLHSVPVRLHPWPTVANANRSHPRSRIRVNIRGV